MTKETCLHDTSKPKKPHITNKVYKSSVVLKHLQNTFISKFTEILRFLVNTVIGYVMLCTLFVEMLITYEHLVVTLICVLFKSIA